MCVISPSIRSRHISRIGLPVRTRISSTIHSTTPAVPDRMICKSATAVLGADWLRLVRRYSNMSSLAKGGCGGGGGGSGPGGCGAGGGGGAGGAGGGGGGSGEATQNPQLLAQERSASTLRTVQ